MTQVLNIKQTVAKAVEAKSNGKKVVFTNGVFDMLHVGHLRYLTAGAQLGDILIVGINSDSSTERLKGSGRPFSSENERAEMIAGLKPVDFVTIFDEDTPIELIKQIKPDFLFKGADYSIDEVVGREFVEENGGRVETIKFESGYSTTKFVKVISDWHRANIE